MYTNVYSIPLKGSVSLAQNNLSILNREKVTLLSSVGKHCVYLTFYENDKHVSQTQIIPKINKNVASEGQQLINIIEAKFVELADRSLLVILTTKGIFFYEEDGSNLIYFHELNMKPSLPEETIYSRGISALSPNMVAIGTSYGIVLIFEIPPKGNKISLKNEIDDKDIQSGISALTSDDQGYYLCAADTSGSCVVFNVKTINNIKKIYAFNQIKESISCLAMWNDYLIAGYGTGVIRVFDIHEGFRLIDINAHARWIYSLDIKKNVLLSSGEDCCFRLWEFSDVNRRLKVNHLYTGLLNDTLITSAQFNKSTNEIYISSFDNSEIQVYKSL